MKLSRLVWQITLLEQNNLTFSFDICVRLLQGANGMRPFGSAVKSTLAVSVRFVDGSCTCLVNRPKNI